MVSPRVALEFKAPEHITHVSDRTYINQFIHYIR